MVEYKCPRCGYKSKYKNDIRRHYNRKKICKVLFKDIPIQICIENIGKPEKEYSELDIVKHQLKEKEKEIEKLKKSQASVINNTTHNTTNNNQNITNYNIINISAFGDTDYTALKDDILHCIENQDPGMKVPMFEQIVHKIHFNKDKPENHNIYKPNVRDDRILTYNGEDFIIDKQAIDKIVTKLEKAIETNFDPIENKKIIEKLKCHLKLKQKDGDYINETNDDIGVVLYNGRNLVKNTHKKT